MESPCLGSERAATPVCPLLGAAPLLRAPSGCHKAKLCVLSAFAAAVPRPRATARACPPWRHARASSSSSTPVSGASPSAPRAWPTCRCPTPSFTWAWTSPATPASRRWPPSPERVAVLFPGEGAMTLEQARASPPETLIVVDGTWPLAKKVVKNNPVLAGLPRIGFTPRRPSNYRIRAEPAEHCVSTIEAVVEVLGAPRGRRPRALRRHAAPLRVHGGHPAREPVRARRIRRAAASTRPRGGLPSSCARWPRTSPGSCSCMPRPTPTQSRRAWSPSWCTWWRCARPPTSASSPFWCPASRWRAARRCTPSCPRSPCARERSGTRRWRRFEAFLRPDEMLAVWTTYALDLLWRDGVSRRPAANVRLAAARALKGKAGGVEQAVPLLKAQAPELWAPGPRGAAHPGAGGRGARARPARGLSEHPPQRG